MIEGEAIVLDRANERIHQVNEVGAFILECCDGTRTEDEIVDALLDRYDVARSRAAADTAELLARLRALDVFLA